MGIATAIWINQNRRTFYSGHSKLKQIFVSHLECVQSLLKSSVAISKESNRIPTRSDFVCNAMLAVAGSGSCQDVGLKTEINFNLSVFAGNDQESVGTNPVSLGSML